MRRSHHMPKRWLVKRRLLVLLEATYTAAAIREVLVCSTETTNDKKIFVVKFICIKYFRMFSVNENIFTTKTKRITIFHCFLSSFTHRVVSSRNISQSADSWRLRQKFLSSQRFLST